MNNLQFFVLLFAMILLNSRSWKDMLLTWLAVGGFAMAFIGLSHLAYFS
jgi:hypothetical protein